MLKQPDNEKVFSHEFVRDLVGDAAVIVFIAHLVFGREIPSFFILETRLVLGNPSRAAAPLGPPISQSVSSNVRKTRDRMKSLNVPDVQLRVAVFCGHAGVRSNTSSGLGSTPSFDRMTARSIKFWSSRTLPGQE